MKTSNFTSGRNQMRLLSLLCTAVAAFCLLSCTYFNSYEKAIVGKWDVSEIERDIDYNEEPSITLDYFSEATDEYKSDHTEVETGTVKYKFYLDFEDMDNLYAIVLEYNYRYEGTWEIDGNKLKTKGSSMDYEFVNAYEIGDDSDYDIDEDYYINILKNDIDDAHSENRIGLLQVLEKRIISIDDDEFNYEDEEGDEVLLTRIGQ